MRAGDAQVEGDRFESQEWGIRISVPELWRMSAQTSYPSVLLWMHRSNPTGKMLLSAERVPAGTVSERYAAQTAERLAGLGYDVQKPQFHAATGAYWIELDDGTTFFRQALLASNGIGYSLTLAAPGARARTQHLRAFDYALRSLQKIDELEREQPAEASPPADGAPSTTDAGTPATDGAPPTIDANTPVDAGCSAPGSGS